MGQPERACLAGSVVTGMVFLRASSLDDPKLISPSMVVYASRAVSWDHIGGGLPTFAEMPQGGPEETLAAQGQG